MVPSVGLVRVRGFDLSLASRTMPTPVASGLMLGVLAALTVLLLSVPLAPLCALTAGIVVAGFVAAMLAPPDRSVFASEVASPRLRASYQLVLDASSELDAIAATESSLVRRARVLADACGRLARETNRAHAYLADHGEAAIASEVDRLAARAAEATDPAVAGALAEAAAARRSELDTVRAMTATHDRIHAQLELAHASLRRCTAAAVRAAAADTAVAEIAAESLDDEIRELDAGADALEAMSQAA